MLRLPDWSPRLFALVEARRLQQHAWGTNDCCLFCADAALAMTGEDVAAVWRGTYSDEAGAAAILEDKGGIEAFVTSILGAPTGALCARQGDICLLQGKKGLLIGVCVGAEVAAPGDAEQILFPLANALKSWKVG